MLVYVIHVLNCQSVRFTSIEIIASNAMNMKLFVSYYIYFIWAGVTISSTEITVNMDFFLWKSFVRFGNFLQVDMIILFITLYNESYFAHIAI